MDDKALQWVFALMAMPALAGVTSAQDVGASFFQLPNCALRSVSADGNVACGLTQDGEAFKWTRAGGILVLPRRPGASQGVGPMAQSASWDGRVIVGTTRWNGSRVACWWDESNAIHLLEDPPFSNDNGYAYCLSGNGQTIGGHTLWEGGLRATLWSQGVMSTIPVTGGSSYVVRLSFGGEVMLGSTVIGAEAVGFRADAWGGMELLTSVAHGALTPAGMSADGSVIVGYVVEAPTGRRAARWTRSGGIELIDSLLPPGNTDVVDVSADGRLMVGLHRNTVSSAATPWIWDSHHGVRWLQAVAEEQLGEPVPTLRIVTGLSADGRTIIGSVQSGEGFVLRLEAPCPADIDDGTLSGGRDGVAEVTDLAAFLIWMNEGDIRCDLDNGSGTGLPDASITIDDLLYFLVGFEEGC